MIKLLSILFVCLSLQSCIVIGSLLGAACITDNPKCSKKEESPYFEEYWEAYEERLEDRVEELERQLGREEDDDND